MCELPTSFTVSTALYRLADTPAGLPDHKKFFLLIKKQERQNLGVGRTFLVVVVIGVSVGSNLVKAIVIEIIEIVAIIMI